MGTTSAFYTVWTSQRWRGENSLSPPLGVDLLSGDEDQTELTNLDLVAHLEHLCVTRLAVDVGAVERSDVHDLKLTILGAELSVATGNGDIIKEDVSLWVAASGGCRLIQQETRASVRATLDDEQRLPLS